MKSSKTTVKNILVHQFVAEHFVAKKSPDQVFVVHKDGNRLNNYYTNLMWVNQKELTAIQMKNGVFGKDSPRHTKLTESRFDSLRKDFELVEQKKSS